MKEMFLKKFKNNDIISPLLFNQDGKYNYLDQYRQADEDQEYYQDYDDDAEKDIIARFAARRGVTSGQHSNEIKPQPEPKKEVKPDAKQEVTTATAAKKDTKIE